MLLGKKLFVLSLFLGACTQNPNDTKIQYMPDMADGPTVKPQKSFINPPDGSVARNAILYPQTPEESEKLLTNPYRSAKGFGHNLEEGKKLYSKFCVTCHGDNAKGDGIVVQSGFPKPPDLTLPNYAKNGDGFFFHKITHGSAIMPSYGAKLDPSEVWQIVLAVRDISGHLDLPADNKEGQQHQDTKPDSQGSGK